MKRFSPAMLCMVIFCTYTTVTVPTHAEIQSSSFIPFGCKIKGVNFINLSIEQEKYHVPARDIFLMSQCKDGPIDWFTVSSVTPHKITIKIGHTVAGTPLTKRRDAHIEALKNTPRNSAGLIYWDEASDDITSAYVGFSEDGLPITMRCFDKGVTGGNTCTADTKLFPSIPISYDFMIDQLADWKNIDKEARHYVNEIKTSNMESDSNASSKNLQSQPTEAELIRAIAVGCNLKDNDNFIDLFLNQQHYYVPLRKLWVVDKCKPANNVGWFSVSKVTSYKSNLTIKSGDPVKLESDMKEYVSAHPEVKQNEYKLMQVDTQFSTNYVGHAKDGTSLVIACIKVSPASCLVYSRIGITNIQYDLPVKRIAEWYKIDMEMRGYIVQLQSIPISHN